MCLAPPAAAEPVPQQLLRDAAGKDAEEDEEDLSSTCSSDADDVSTTCCSESSIPSRQLSEEEPQEEEPLDADVPTLLETMNMAAEEVNRLERQGSEVQHRYRQRLAHWTSSRAELMATHGCKEIDRASRVLAAEAALRAAAGHAEAALGALVAGSGARSGAAGVSGADAEYAAALAAYREAHEGARRLRARAPEKTLEKAVPALRTLQRRAKCLSSDHQSIAELAQRASASKGLYGSSMAELERISEAIHATRSRGATR